MLHNTTYFSILFILLFVPFRHNLLSAQPIALQGQVFAERTALPFAHIVLEGTEYAIISDSIGYFRFDSLAPGSYHIMISALGYQPHQETLLLQEDTILDISMHADALNLGEIVISATMKEVARLESPVLVEVYNAKYFTSNRAPSLFESLQNTNGVRPQINCNVCNTGDIHINGLEGPYTMILIDGMPIVSGLSTVYGLYGIPQALIDRVEIVKGPASTLYGSEAVGGLINIITKRNYQSPSLAFDGMMTNWGEYNVDLSGSLSLNEKSHSIWGLHYFNYNNPIDKNHDNFTDITLQHRISLFNKWQIDRQHNRLFALAGRYIYEDRWGGELQWNPSFRGSSDIYGESIYTSRWELISAYQLPIHEPITLQISLSRHKQNSAYGDVYYLADQFIGFSQLTWNKKFGQHDFLLGAAYRYTYYDDNTIATQAVDSAGNHDNIPTHTSLPGLFVQDEWFLHDHWTLLMGLRYDHNSLHGSIFTPRLAVKWNSLDKMNTIRFNIGNGYRVANVFTEDHAALTGARDVLFVNELKPETSWNVNINYAKRIYSDYGTIIGMDISAFYTYFNNKIIPDYHSDPNKILYDNLSGHAISKGLTLNMDLSTPIGINARLGCTLMDVSSTEEGIRQRQLFTEKFSAVWRIGYNMKNIGLKLDYTGNLYSPMRLPLLSDTDPRKEYSNWWSIQNIQLTKTISEDLEIFAGVKNLLNWTPNKGNPFIIARAHDPFDKNVIFDELGQAIITEDNPYGLTFDPSYVYGPNQGRKFFLGLRYSLPMKE